MARNTATGHLRIGFDTEFVRAGIRADDLDAAVEIPDDTLRSNEVLCYTAAIRNRNTGAFETGIFNLREGEGGRRDRLTLAAFLSMLVERALDVRIIDAAATRTRPPGANRGPTLRIDLAAHFSRADLCGFKDWKRLRKQFDSVRGTYCTTTFPVTGIAWLSTHRPVVCSVRLYDTMLLAPAGYQSLEKLGELLGEPKIAIPNERKARMDLLRREDPALFERYAIQDAVIAELWLGHMEEFFHSEFGLTGTTPATLASAAVKVFEDMAKREGIDLGEFLGGTTKKGVFTAREEIQDHLSLIANSYHGGRNEAFWVGPTPVENIFDIDIRGAYTAAMAGLRIPDWSGVEVTTDLDRLTVIVDAMTFARVRFRFPSVTRYPSLPVRANEGRGLLYPLGGETHATGPELVVALQQGADIEVLHGLRVPFDQSDPRRPFAAFSRRIAEVRSKYRNTDMAMEKVAKEMGNATYGKTAQAVDAYRTTGTGVRARGKRVFDAREGKSKELPPSRITSPPMAAWITGMVRALCSECIDSIPACRNVYTVTTDGWLTNAPLEEVRVDGPVATAFADLRQIVGGDRRILELKHGARQCIVVKTRGTFTVEPMDGYKPVLARAGQRMEQRLHDNREESIVWAEIYRSRTYDLQTTHKQLISLRDQWKHASDLVDTTRTVRMNLEFDFKRRLVSPSDNDGMLMANTRPWRTLGQFEQYRDAFEQWRKTFRRCCVMKSDLDDFEEWNKARPQKREAGMTSKSNRPPLVQMLFRAWGQRLFGTPGRDYRQLAAITSRWWPTSAEAIKKAKRNGNIRPVEAVGPREVEWAYAVASRWPGIDWWFLIAPNSQAAEFILWADFDWWDRRLHTPEILLEVCEGGRLYSPPIRMNDPLEEFEMESGDDEEESSNDAACGEGVVCSESAVMCTATGRV